MHANANANTIKATGAPAPAQQTRSRLGALLGRIGRQWTRSDLEAAIDDKVRAHLGGRPAEPGDVVLVNQFIDELSRSTEGRH